ncbi:MAG: ABC transporter ATP-binding protein, partial [Spirochaetales bacterium]|nr:ABC transporter ATP-binding protein [Spirochaetales bacterium]
MANAKKRNTFSDDELLEQEFNLEQLKKLLAYLGKYKWRVIQALIVTVISALANLVTPLLMKVVIDDIIPNKDLKYLVVASIVFTLIIILSSVCMKYRIRYMSAVGQSVIEDIRFDIFTHIQKLPFTFYDSRPHGKILVRIVNYVNSLSDLISNGFINLIVDGFSFIVALVVMLILDFRLTFIVLAFVPFALAGIIYIQNKQRKSMQEVSAKQANMNAYIHESISGMKVTQSFTREDVNMKVFTGIMDEYQDKWMESRRYIALIFPVIKNISVISQCALIVAALAIFKGQVTAGVVVAALGYSGNFWMPLINISEFYNQLVSASAYLERIFETIDIKPEIEDSASAYTLPMVKGDIKFENVVFGYDKNQVILNNFNL